MSSKSKTPSSAAVIRAGSGLPSVSATQLPVDRDNRQCDVTPACVLALTNVGHFTSMRTEADGCIRGLALHMDRLVRDSKIVWGVDLDTGRVREYVRQSLEGQALPCVVRVTVYDPKVEMGRPVDAEEPHIMVSVRGRARCRLSLCGP